MSETQTCPCRLYVQTWIEDALSWCCRVLHEGGEHGMERWIVLSSNCFMVALIGACGWFVNFYLLQEGNWLSSSLCNTPENVGNGGNDAYCAMLRVSE